ncbi:Rpn family recombination-promoting nuclease/putative transposase [Bacillus toyonensis]|uniref:ATPase n=1 Tax=Bacillus toyonensis TaxID=155322 RepID=A0A2C4R4T9_9BACI|nr:Rpn family recombination-promoting nuclease/putative transposase [Bacillus toyonensis]PGA96890.1 ATPase [Bacillus toyonensis]PHD72436.1 ATPase [Bacillus toyonensis]
MNQPLVNLRVDFAFKQLFGTRGNEQILMQFLNVTLASSLSSPIQTLKIEDPHMHREYEKDKLSILDVLATLDDDTQIAIEIQLNDQNDFLKRSLYYWSRLYASQIQKGDSYDALRKTITINILNFPVFPEYETFHTTGKLWDMELKKLLIEDMEIHVIEIPKLMAQWKQEQVNPWEDAFVRWLLLLSANEDPQLTHTLEEIAMNRDPILKDAMQKWEKMSQDPGFRMLYEARQKALIDEASKYKYAEKKGIEKGRKEGKEEGLQEGIAKGMEKGKEVGIQEGKIQLIQGMHKNGMDIEDIAKFTNIELSDIRHILGQ